MIEFKSIELEEFGPYRGIQTLEFERRAGVWIVYGDNGRGKTSLLNAFRYALYGEMQGRISEIPPRKMVNTVSRRANDGVGRMRVTVEMKVQEDEEWEVTRLYDESSSPAEKLFVAVNGETKTAAEGERKLRTILPPELSDFFLFDGEDLRQYEHLLEQDSAAADRLKEAIERVLGLPTLRQAAVALEEINSEATKRVAEHMKRSDQTREAGEVLEEAQELLDEYRREREREKEILEDKEGEKKRHEAALEEHERAKAIMEQLEVLRNERETVEDELETAERKLEEATSQKLWKTVLKDACRRKIEDLNKRERNLRQHTRTAGFVETVRRRLERDPDNCPVCGEDLEEEHRAEIIKALPSLSDDGASGSIDLGRVAEKKTLLQEIVSSAEEQVLRDREERVDGRRLELRKKEAEIDEKEEALEELGKEEAEIRKLKGKRDDCTTQIGKIEDRLEDIEEKIEEQRNIIPDLKDKATREVGEVDPTTQTLERVSEEMAKLFDKTSDEYREVVRHNIEEKAATLFTRIAAEKDYKSLEINENYGLSIIDENGEQVPNRSAGYEHLVAFSLLAALQSYSPNRGPVVVDSPFQRLDAKNTRLVMGALPDMANQTLLLVFEKQFDRQAAIEALEGDLVEEFELERESSKETKLVVR